jgi:hypothetical protein
MINEGHTLKNAAAKAGIDPKTARKYLKTDSPGAEANHNWRTKKDDFVDVWAEISAMLVHQPRLEAKTIFSYLVKKYPGQFQEGQLRTLQRKVKQWKGLSGESKEVYFTQVHKPGVLSASDFSHMDSLGVTIQGRPFAHLVYHFVLTYSNWESVTICFSENLESLSEGFQNALWQLGKAPLLHITDRLTAAVSNFANRPKFGERYQALLDHYGIQGKKTQASSPNENGDVEQSHNRFKKAVDQTLMLRDCRDFSSLNEYRAFLRDIIIERNSARSERFKEEFEYLKELPETRLQDATVQWLRVGRGSSISVKKVPYSVPSRLIGEEVEARISGTMVEIWFQGHKVEEHVRLSGQGKASIKYSHIIDWLIRKPGAFENYLYKEQLFPTSTFRAAYDALKASYPQTFVKQYLGILKAASKDGETRVGHVLKNLITSENLSLQFVLDALSAPEKIESIMDVTVFEIDLDIYDSAFLENGVQA